MAKDPCLQDKQEVILLKPLAVWQHDGKKWQSKMIA